MSNIFEAFVAGLKGINAKQTESETEAKVEYAVVSTAAVPADSNLSKLPFALAITALVLSLTFLFSLSGAVLGIVAAAILYLLKKNGIQASYSRATAIIAACALLLGACCACSYAVASAYRPADMPDSTPLASTYQPEAEPETTIEEATFTLEIAAPGTKSSSDSDSSISKLSANSSSSASSSASSAPSKPSVPETVAVNISGTTEDGLTVSGTKPCTPGQAYELDLAPGKYILSFDAIAMPDGETFYKAASTTCTFTGEDSTAAYLEPRQPEPKLLLQPRTSTPSMSPIPAANTTALDASTSRRAKTPSHYPAPRPKATRLAAAATHSRASTPPRPSQAQRASSASGFLLAPHPHRNRGAIGL